MAWSFFYYLYRGSHFATKVHFIVARNSPSFSAKRDDFVSLFVDWNCTGEDRNSLWACGRASQGLANPLPLCKNKQLTKDLNVVDELAEFLLFEQDAPTPRSSITNQLTSAPFVQSV